MTAEVTSVELREVSPRDGLQDHPHPVSTDVKVELIRRAMACGLRSVEVTSFAHPERVPQMADAEAVISRTADLEDLDAVTLVLNERGLDRAISAGIRRINVVVVVTDTFSARNQGVTVAEALAAWARIAGRAHTAGIAPEITVSAAFGCPFEGDVPMASVMTVVRRAMDARPAALTLADTIGAAVPTMVEDLVHAAVQLGGAPVRGHLHDTRNTGVANAVAALGAGAEGLDVSIGGLGGCPFAPGATGNVATEDVVWCLERMGVRTGVHLPAVLATVNWMEENLAGRRLGGALHRARAFPPDQLST